MKKIPLKHSNLVRWAMAYLVCINIAFATPLLETQIEQRDVVQEFEAEPAEAAEPAESGVEASVKPEQDKPATNTEEQKPANKPKPTSNRIITIETEVKGSTEQPKVLTLVPWQAPVAPQGLYIPMTQSLPTNIFQPVTKAALKRMISTYKPVIPIDDSKKK